MLDRLSETVHPDVISLAALSRMFTPQMFDNVMQPDLFGPRFQEAIRGGPVPCRERIGRLCRVG
jgi:hypothetical protein